MILQTTFTFEHFHFGLCSNDSFYEAHDPCFLSTICVKFHHSISPNTAHKFDPIMHDILTNIKFNY